MKGKIVGTSKEACFSFLLAQKPPQHSQETDIHDHGWIRTHYLSSRTATATG